MNPEELLQTAQKGFHMTLGATAAVIESLQDARKREENTAKLRQDWGQLSEELVQKGQQTEQEARIFVDGLLNQGKSGATSSSGAASAPDMPTAPPEVQQDLQTLTEQLAALRQELEQLRNQQSPD